MNAHWRLATIAKLVAIYEHCGHVSHDRAAATLRALASVLGPECSACLRRHGEETNHACE